MSPTLVYHFRYVTSKYIVNYIVAVNQTWRMFLWKILTPWAPTFIRLYSFDVLIFNAIDLILFIVSYQRVNKIITHFFLFFAVRGKVLNELRLNSKSHRTSDFFIILYDVFFDTILLRVSLTIISKSTLLFDFHICRNLNHFVICTN